MKTPLIENLIDKYDSGEARCIVRDGKVEWVHTFYVQTTDHVVPREQLKIVEALDWMHREGSVEWVIREDELAVYWPKDHVTGLVSDLGLSRELGFYSLSEWPDVENLCSMD